MYYDHAAEVADYFKDKFNTMVSKPFSAKVFVNKKNQLDMVKHLILTSFDTKPLDLKSEPGYRNNLAKGYEATCILKKYYNKSFDEKDFIEDLLVLCLIYEKMIEYIDNPENVKCDLLMSVLEEYKKGFSYGWEKNIVVFEHHD